MFTNIDGVIFDLDGTLIDSMWLWEDIDVSYLKKHGIDLPEDLRYSIQGMSTLETAYYFKDRFNIKESIEEMLESWVSMATDYYLNRVPLKKGAKELVESLYGRGIKLAIGTSNFAELAEMILIKLDIRQYFSAIATSHEANKGKPAPDVFLLAAKKIDVAPERCLVFEDIENGIIAAHSAGMLACAVYDEFSKDFQDDLIKVADYYIKDFNELKLI